MAYIDIKIQQVCENTHEPMKIVVSFALGLQLAMPWSPWGAWSILFECTFFRDFKVFSTQYLLLVCFSHAFHGTFFLRHLEFICACRKLMAEASRDHLHLVVVFLHGRSVQGPGAHGIPPHRRSKTTSTEQKMFFRCSGALQSWVSLGSPRTWEFSRISV